MRFVDLFAGIGGFRLGLQASGMNCVFSADLDKKAEQTYAANFGCNYDAYDINTISELPSCEVVAGGFPCQPYSIAGKRGGLDDDRSQPVFKMIDLASQAGAKVLLLENVPNIRSVQSGNAFKAILRKIEDAGYVWWQEILNSDRFGVPQSRKRLFLVAFHKSTKVGSFVFPAGENKYAPVSSVIVQGDHSVPVSERWNTYIDLYSGNIDLEDVPFEVPKTRRKLERADEGVDLNNCIYQMRSSGIRALSLNKPLPTLAVSVSGGGAMIPVFSSERRHLSVLELKRIMGFPDSFKFPVARTHAIKQLANAVCPPVVEQIGVAIKASLSGDFASVSPLRGQLAFGL